MGVCVCVRALKQVLTMIVGRFSAAAFVVSSLYVVYNAFDYFEI